MELNYQEMLFQFLGGLGIFLLGLQFMGDGLKKSAGDKLRDILNAFTSTPLKAVIAGIVVTVLIQSSSGATVLTVGLVSAGFMTLKQAIGVIMGANIGTTITAFIIGFDIGAYALPIMGVGALLIFFSKRPFINSVGEVLFGFGSLFFGLELMGGAMEPLEALPQFRDLMVQLSENRFLSLLTGTGLTLIIQSSSGVIGILQEIYSHGSVSLEAAIPILFGSNIGTTITAIIAAIGASVAAKRTAATHVIFNVIGTILVFLVYQPYLNLIIYLSQQFDLNPSMQIAFAHGIFNVANVIIQFWFIGLFEKAVVRIVPGEDRVIEYESVLDVKLLQGIPSIAIEQARLEVNQLGSLVNQQFAAASTYYRKKDVQSKEEALRVEEIINQVDYKLTEYLMRIAEKDLTESSSAEQAVLMDVTKYLERIGDHSENVVKNIQEALELAKKDIKNKKNGESVEEILKDEDVTRLFDLVRENIEDAVTAFVEDSYKAAGRVINREKEINELETTLRSKYINRLNAGEGLPSDGILFIDIVAHLERISDHTVKIAKHTLGIRYPFQVNKKSTVRSRDPKPSEV